MLLSLLPNFYLSIFGCLSVLFHSWWLHIWFLCISQGRFCRSLGTCLWWWWCVCNKEERKIYQIYIPFTYVTLRRALALYQILKIDIMQNVIKLSRLLDTSHRRSASIQLNPFNKKKKWLQIISEQIWYFKMSSIKSRLVSMCGYTELGEFSKQFYFFNQLQCDHLQIKYKDKWRTRTCHHHSPPSGQCTIAKVWQPHDYLHYFKQIYIPNQWGKSYMHTSFKRLQSIYISTQVPCTIRWCYGVDELKGFKIIGLKIFTF